MSVKEFISPVVVFHNLNKMSTIYNVDTITESQQEFTSELAYATAYVPPLP